MHGANCYGSGILSFKDKKTIKHTKGLDKISYEERVNWVMDHHKLIMSMDEKF